MYRDKEPKISVIMSVYNQKCIEQLEESIWSILKQTRSDFEFLIYNDGSDSDVMEHLVRLGKQDERIRLLESSENNGVAYSLNSCIKVAKGEYIARMDCDDISKEDRFQVQAYYLDMHPEIHFVGCNAYLLDEKNVWGIRKMSEYPEESDYLKYSPFIHPTIMIRRSVLENNAYSEDKENWRCEDYELFTRLYHLGYKGVNIQRKLFYYRENAAAYRKRKLKFRYQEFCLRQKMFEQINVDFHVRFFYTIRPLVSAVIPASLLFQIRKGYYRKSIKEEQENYEKKVQISGSFEKTADHA